MEELKPCPFCGGDARAFKRTCDKDTRYDPSHRAFPIVRCGSCGACAEGDDWTEPQVAIERWNRRAQQAEAVPTTHALVPVEPTLEMGWAYLDAANAQDPLRHHVFNHDGYRAMVKAAIAAQKPAT